MHFFLGFERLFHIVDVVQLQLVAKLVFAVDHWRMQSFDHGQSVLELVGANLCLKQRLDSRNQVLLVLGGNVAGYHQSLLLFGEGVLVLLDDELQLGEVVSGIPVISQHLSVAFNEVLSFQFQVATDQSLPTDVLWGWRVLRKLSASRPKETVAIQGQELFVCTVDALGQI